MPVASNKRTNGRAVLAGFGTTVSLSGAATVAALVITGIVAFSSWPDGNLRQQPDAVRLADPAPSGASGFASAVSIATSAALGESVNSERALPGDTPTSTPGVGPDGETGSGNLPTAAAGTPSPQPSVDPVAVRPTSAPADAVATATTVAAEEVRQQLATVSGAATNATGAFLPRTSKVLSDYTNGLATTADGTSRTVAEVIRELPPGATP